MGATVRSAVVRLEAMVAKYIRDMERAGNATERSFDKVEASSTRARDSMLKTEASSHRLAGSLDEVRKSSRRANTELGSTTKNLDRLNVSTTRLNRATAVAVPSQRKLATEVDRVSVAAVRGSSSIDKYSGRLRVLLDLLAVGGPGLLAVGGAGLAGIAGLAALFGGATVGALGLVGAVQGVGDALKTVEEARLDPTVENLQKAEEAMSRIGPAAREFVTQFQELRPLLRELRDAGAEEFFPGLTASLDSLERLEPVLKRIMAASGRAGGNAVARGAESLASERWAPFLDFLTEEIPQATEGVTRILGGLAHAGAELWMAFDPGNDRFIDWLGDVADGFDRWAGSAEGRADIAAFLGYVEETAPKVGDFVVAAADAFTQLVQAAAPLSGPVLEGLTAVSKAVAAVADSDLGTPIMTGVAALALYTRSLQVAAALQTRLTGSTALSSGMAAGGIFGASRAGARGVRGVGADLRRVGQNWRYLGTSAAFAEAKQSRAIVGMAKGAAVAGGLALATSGVADGMGLANTATFALLGTMAGPWGAAVGAGIGLVADITAANRRWEESLAAINAALESGDSEQIQAANKALGERLDYLRDLQRHDGFGDFISDAIQTKLGFDLPTQKDFDEATFGSFTPATGGLQATAAALGDIRAQAALAANEVEDLRQELTNAATVLTKQGQFDAYQAAIDNLTDSVKENGETLDSNTAKGRANREALNSIADAAITYSQNLQGADRIDFLKNARLAFIDGAEKAGGLDRRARAVLKTLNDLIGDYQVNVKGNTQDLKRDIATAERLLRALTRPRTVSVRAQVSGLVDLTGVGRGGGKPKKTNPSGFNALGGAGADGMTVPGARQPYRDKVLIYAAPGEEVISNRHGQADRFRADRAAGRIPAYAGGGTIAPMGAGPQRLADGGTVSTRSKSADTAEETKQVSRRLRELRRELGLATKAVEKERAQRDRAVGLRNDLRSGIREGLDNGGIWRPGQDNVWTSSGSPLDKLRADIAGINQYDKLTGRIKRKARKGGVRLNGGALDAILAEGDIETLQAYEGMSAQDLAAYVRLYNRKESRLTAVSRSGGDAAWLPAVQRGNAELAEANRELKQIKKAVDRNGKKNSDEHHKDRAESRKGAGRVSRGRSRGYVR